MKDLKTYILIAVFAGIAIWQGGASFSRYSTPADALARGGRVQILGTLWDDGKEFAIRGKLGDEILLDIKTGFALRLESGKEVVAVGVVQEGRLRVERLLYKCPSKYEKGE